MSQVVAGPVNCQVTVSLGFLFHKKGVEPGELHWSLLALTLHDCCSTPNGKLPSSTVPPFVQIIQCIFFFIPPVCLQMLGKALERKNGGRQVCMAALGGMQRMYTDKGVPHPSCLALADGLGSSMSQASNGTLVMPT